MKYLVIIKQRITYNQETEFSFESYSEASDFVKTALLRGNFRDRTVTAEIVAIPDPELYEVKQMAIDTDFDD